MLQFFLKQFKRKLSTKIFFSFTLFVCTISLSFTCLSYLYESTSQTNAMVEKGILLVQMLANGSRIGVYSENMEFLEPSLDGVLQEESVISAVVYNSEDDLLIKIEKSSDALHGQNIGNDDTADTDYYEKILESEKPLFVESIYTIEFWAPVIRNPDYSLNEYLYFDENIAKPKTNITGFVRVTIDKQDLQKKLNTLLFESIILGIVYLCLGLTFSYLLSNGITSPLKRLTRDVKSYGEQGVVRDVSVETQDEVGKLAMAFNRMTDTLKKREAALRESETRFRMQYKGIPVPTFTWKKQDLHFILLECNHSAIDFTEGEIKRYLGTRADLFFENQPEIITNLHKCYIEKKMITMEISDKLRATKEEKDLRISLVYIQPDIIMAHTEDITEKRRAEKQAKIHQEQLYQADKMIALGTIVSGVAHEINNPNNFIALNVPMLNKIWVQILPILDDYAEKNGDFIIVGFPYSVIREKFLKTCANILEGSHRIGRIVKDLKTFSVRNVHEKTEIVEINSVLQYATNLLENMIRKSTNRFTTDFGKLPLFYGNRQHLEQTFINLIQNACNAIQDKDKALIINTHYNILSKTIVVTIQDEGSGILPENLSRIFDPFFTTRRESGGTGLGLSICQRIVKNLNGKIEFTSKPMYGTTVHVTLPVRKNIQ